MFAVLEASTSTDWRGRAVDAFIIVLILASVVSVSLETVPSVAGEYSHILFAFDVFSIAVFTVEYALRVWVCIENPVLGQYGAVKGRLRYMTSPMALIDLVAILPFYLGFIVDVDLRFMRVFRVLRLLKLTRYSPAIETVFAVLIQQRRPLVASLIIMLILLVVSASVAYMFEHQAQPDKFGSIPHSLWWAIATLATVGYGDVTPVTAGGKLFGSVIMILGVGMYALPTGILAMGFHEEFRRRDFTVTWGLVASVPLFADLDAKQIAEITRHLQPKLVPPRYAIVRHGEAADSMYFIVSGEVEVEIHPHPVHLGPGDFFGEIALLKHQPRMATVTAITECQLLFLEIADFQRLLRDHPMIAEAVTGVAEKRLKEIEAMNLVH